MSPAAQGAVIIAGAALIAAVVLWALLGDRPDTSHLDAWIPPRRAVADVIGIGEVTCRCGATTITAPASVRAATGSCPTCGQYLEAVGA